MKKAKRKPASEMREEYDFSKGVRSKYACRMSRTATVVVLEPDVAEVFDSSESVKLRSSRSGTDRTSEEGQGCRLIG